MTVRRWEERRPIVQGSTAPIWEELITEQDGVTVRNLTGYHVYLTFWYASAAAPHKVGHGYVYDAANGLVRYELDGTETPTAGNLLYQVTLGNAGSTNESVQTWGEMTSPVFKRTVLAAAP